MSTKQETYNIVVEHARKQGCKSEKVDETGSRNCRYRLDGLKCFIGALIPDNRYDPKMENKAVTSNIISDLLVDLGHDLDLCRILQSIHDAYDIEEWEDEFREIAKMYDLVYTAPEE